MNMQQVVRSLLIYRLSDSGALLGIMALAHALPELDRQLASSSWLAGDHFSMADIDLLVAVDFMAWVKQAVPQECEHLQAWYSRAKAELGL